MILIKVPYQYYDSYSRVVLERKEYLLRFTYNTVFDYWTMGIYDTDRNPLTSGMKLVPNFPLNHYLKKDNTPKGVFTVVCIANKDNIGKNDFENGNAGLVYVPLEELGEDVKIYEEY